MSSDRSDLEPSKSKWFGSLPESWESLPLKRLAKPGIETFTDGDWVESPHITDSGIRLIQTGNIGIGEFDDKDAKYISEESFHELDCTEVYPGDVLISRLGGRPVGRACIAPDLDNRMIASVDVAILRTRNKISPRYIVDLMSTEQYLEFCDALCRGGTLDRLSRSMLGDIQIPIAPYQIQKNMASFLHRHKSSIDNVVIRLKDLIDELHTKRKALITKSVTSGLVEDVKFYKSGVDWIGQIPKHWDVVRTRFVARLESGHTPSKSNEEYWKDCKIPWVTTSDIKPFREGRKIYLEDTEYKINQLGLENSGARMLPEGTVFLSRTASVGFSGIMGKEMATSQDFANWIPGDKVISEYLLYVFRSMDQEFDRLTQGSTHQTIYMPDIRSFKMPLPPKEEQQEIVEHIQRETEKIWELIDKIDEAIDLLKEKRQALITAAVTGQIDVTEAQSGEQEVLQ